MLNRIRDKSLVYLEPKIILGRFFPLSGIFFLFADEKITFFLCVVNFLFVLVPVTREPDLESKSDLIGERIELICLSLLNFVIPVFIPLCLKRISAFPPEDFSDSYSLTNRKFLFNHGRLSFNVLFHSCALSPICALDDRLMGSVVVALSLNEYIVPGLKKMSLGGKWYDWIFAERIGYLHYWSRKYGWAEFLSEKQSLSICKMLNRFSVVLNLGCLFFEIAGPILIVLSKYAWCAGTISFHAMVFAFTGILFWQNIVLISMLSHFCAFDPLLVWLFCMVLIDKTKTRPLGWVSTRLCEKVEIVGVLEDGSELVMQNDAFGARERTIGIRQGSVLVGGNYRTFHIGEATHDSSVMIERSKLEELKQYRYAFKMSMNWLSYFKKFIHRSKDKDDWIWDKIVPEGQIFYTKKNRYKKGISLKGINFVLRCWYLNDDYQEFVLEERLLMGVNGQGQSVAK